MNNSVATAKSAIFALLMIGFSGPFCFGAKTTLECQLPMVPEPVKLQALDDMGIPYLAQKKFFVGEEDGSWEQKTDGYILDVELGPLTIDQFKMLTKRFGTIDLKYEKEKKYQLIQFLTPLMQALNGRQFVSQHEKFAWPSLANIPSEDEETVEVQQLERFKDEPLTINTNCWTTAYEIIRTGFDPKAATTYDLGFISRAATTTDLTKNYMKRLGKNDKPQWLDLLLFTSLNRGAGQHLVQHAVVHVMPGVYFEKTDSGDQFAFRLALETDIRSSLASIGITKSAYYRMKPRKVLPRIRDTKVLGAEGDDFYRRLFSPEDLSSIAFESDWLHLSQLSRIERLVTEPYRILKFDIIRTRDGFRLNSYPPGFRTPEMH